MDGAVVRRKNNVLLGCDDVLTNMLEGVCQAALRKADLFVGDVRIKADGVPEFVVAVRDKSEMVFQGQMQKYEEKEAALDREMAVEKAKKLRLVAEIEQLTLNVKREQQIKEQAGELKRQALARLGTRPSAEIRHVTKTRMVERSVFNPCRWFGDKYTTESYQESVTDDSRGQQWENKRREIEGSCAVQLMEYDQLMKQLQLEINQRKKNAQDDSVIKMYQARLQDVTKQKQMVIQEQKEAKEKAFVEYINLQRKHLYSGLECFFADLVKQSTRSLQESIANNRGIILTAVNAHCNALSEQYKKT